MPGWFSPAMALSSLAMLLVSIGMVYWSGDTEPFFGPFDLQAAVISLVGGGVCLLFWLTWGAGIVIAVRKNWWPPVSLALISLVLFGLLLGAIVVFSYLGDRQNWAEHAPF